MTAHNLSIHIDLDRCEGHSLCIQQAPDLFALSDDDVAVVIEEGAAVEHESSLRAAVAACPRQAISVSTEHAQ